MQAGGSASSHQHQALHSALVEAGLDQQAAHDVLHKGFNLPGLLTLTSLADVSAAFPTMLLGHQCALHAFLVAKRSAS